MMIFSTMPLPSKSLPMEELFCGTCFVKIAQKMGATEQMLSRTQNQSLRPNPDFPNPDFRFSLFQISVQFEGIPLAQTKQF